MTEWALRTESLVPFARNLRNATKHMKHVVMGKGFPGHAKCHCNRHNYQGFQMSQYVGGIPGQNANEKVNAKRVVNSSEGLGARSTQYAANHPRHRPGDEEFIDCFEFVSACLMAGMNAAVTNTAHTAMWRLAHRTTRHIATRNKSANGFIDASSTGFY